MCVADGLKCTYSGEQGCLCLSLNPYFRGLEHFGRWGDGHCSRPDVKQQIIIIMIHPGSQHCVLKHSHHYWDFIVCTGVMVSVCTWYWHDQPSGISVKVTLDLGLSSHLKQQNSQVKFLSKETNLHPVRPLKITNLNSFPKTEKCLKWAGLRRFF